MKISKFIHYLSPAKWLDRLGVPLFMQVASGLTLLTACSVLLAKTFNLIPSDDDAMLSRRSLIAETVAMNAASMIKVGANSELQLFPATILSRYHDVTSIALRRQDGLVLAATPGHESYWRSDIGDGNMLTRIQIPLLDDQKVWGRVEMSFVPPPVSQLFLGLDSRTLAQLLFVPLAAFLLFWIYLRRALRVLDPSSAIPQRLQMLLDTMVEGVVILDLQGRIVVVNDAFADSVFLPPSRLMGKELASLSWTAYESDSKPDSFPWTSAIQNNLAHRGVRLRIKVGTNQFKFLLVNASPIRRDDGACQGALATFSELHHDADEDIPGAIEPILNAKAAVEEIQDDLNTALVRHDRFLPANLRNTK